VHRDVKPANILVAGDDHAYLSDFGAVKELASGGTTRTGAFVGTLEYSAPEQIEGGAVDARTDVYALACVLYECLAGAPPFHRPTEVAVLNAHLHAEPPKLTQAVPELPEALEQVVEKALSKSPLDRYGSCGELVAAARATAAERRVHRRRLAVSLALLALAAALGAAVTRRVPQRALRLRGRPSARRPAPERARGEAGSGPRARGRFGRGRRARNPRRGGASARAPTAAADARPLPLGAAGRSARSFPRRPPHAGRATRDRAEPRLAGARARDPSSR